MATETIQGQPDQKLILRLRDVLKEPLYGRSSGSTGPVLLLAAGHRIESELQLRRLREAGFSVVLPSEQARSAAASRQPPAPMAAPAEAASESATLVDRLSALPLDAELTRRLEAAIQVREAASGAVRQLMGRVRTGAAPDVEVLQGASTMLVSKVTADPQAYAALTCLRQCDEYTIEHSADVAILMVAIAQLLGRAPEEMPVLALAGLMHDVGKQKIPLEILLKPEILTPSEFAEVRRHPNYGYDLLSCCDDCPEEVRVVALQHHERLDGSGYPAGLTQHDIHPYSSLAAVADTFDAITADRVYCSGRSPRSAVLELYGSRKRRLDTEAVQALIKLVGVYPVGTRVLLDSGEQGVVIAPNPDDTTRPVVLVDQDSQGRLLALPVAIELQSGTHRIVGTSQ